MGAVRVERSRETYVRVQGVLVRKERKASACHPPRKVYLDAHDISGSNYRRRARRVRRGIAVGAGGRESAANGNAGGRGPDGRATHGGTGRDGLRSVERSVGEEGVSTGEHRGWRNNE